MRFGLGIWTILVLLVSCGDKSSHVTRAQCGKVADHIADLIIDHYASHPDELWDGMTAEPGDTGLPKAVTKQTLKAYLETPEGKTWLMQRRGQARTGTEAAVDQCVEHATPALVACLLSAKTRDDVTACDKAKK